MWPDHIKCFAGRKLGAEFLNFPYLHILFFKVFCVYEKLEQLLKRRAETGYNT